MQYLTINEVAAVLKLNRKTVWSLCKRGEIPYLKVGRLIRIASEELDAYLKSARHDVRPLLVRTRASKWQQTCERVAQSRAIEQLKKCGAIK